MNTKSAYRAALAAGAAFTAFTAFTVLSTRAYAAEVDDSIVVTGQRQQYRGDIPVKDLPQTVQIIDAKILDQLNVTRLDAALDLASGISKQNNFGGLWDAFAVRGFAGDENFPSGFLVNGFNGGRGYGGPRDASNIDHIEVLKGPNAAVFGRGEPGGTVNIITKKATLRDTFGSFGVSAGSFSAYRVEGDYNLKISDSFAVRVNGAAERADSFRNTIQTQKKVLTPSALWNISDKTSVAYEMEYVNQDVPFDRGVVAINGVLGKIDRSTFLGEPGDGPINVKVLGHQLQLQQDLGHDWVFLLGGGLRKTSFRGFSEDPELALARQIIDNDGINLARQRRYRDYQTKNYSLRGELSGKIQTGPFTHHVIMGADTDTFDIELYQIRYRPPSYTTGAAITAANNAINVFNPIYGQLPAGLPIPGTVTPVQDFREVQKSWGAYFNDQIDITDRIKLRFGGRYDNFQQKIGPRWQTGTLRQERNRFSPAAGALVKLTDTVSLYGGYGTGFRPNSGLDAAGNPFAPETSKSYEAGLRYVSPGNGITASVAAFTMQKTNILTSDPINAGFSIAGGEARSKGIEADLNANLPGDTHVIATYAYTDAYWSSSSLDPNFSQVILPGARLINIPKHAANLLVTKGFDLGNSGKVTVGGGVNYVSSRLGETATSFYLPSYTLARALVSYEPMKNVKIGVDVTNLFDVTWYASSYSSLWVQPGAPRTITGRVTFGF
jgi:iron complex outermembrane receptor protein